MDPYPIDLRALRFTALAAAEAESPAKYSAHVQPPQRAEAKCCGQVVSGFPYERDVLDRMGGRGKL